MSYHTWSTYGLGFRVDDINTTPERVLKLAGLNAATKIDLELHIRNNDEELTMDLIDDFEGAFGERGLSCILREVIEMEMPIVWVDDFDGVNYILYCPSFPWNLKESEKNLTEESVKNILKKYIKILTDEPIDIYYYSVENGG
jgi:hypothetical protein